MKKITLLFYIVFLSTAVTAQTDAGIIGKWKYSSIYNAAQQDSAKLTMLDQFFGNTTLYLKSSTQYTLVMMAKEEGNWVYDTASKMMTLTANKGTISQLTLDLIAKDTLLLSLAKGKTLVMTRAMPDATDEPASQAVKPGWKPITPQQLCKKWFLQSREVPGRTKEQSQMVTDLFKGSFFNFKLNNTYEVVVGKISESGTWSLGNNNSTLYLAVDESKKFWNIRSITASELVLIRGNGPEVWTFSVKK